MRKYFKYFIYIVEHKKNVFIECIKDGLFIHAFTHDLSKFRISEFVPYARFFFRTDRSNNYNIKDELDKDFQYGWNHHQKRNKHHWNYWVSITRKNEIIPIPMSEIYVRQMLCDWGAMSRKFGGDIIKYYDDNKEKMILHEITMQRIEESMKKGSLYDEVLYIISMYIKLVYNKWLS